MDINRYVITEFGAVGDGSTVNTSDIQKCIDTCAEDGGGEVLIPPGDFVTGTIFLKSDVVINISSGATLLGSTHIVNYAPEAGKQMYDGEPHMDRCLIYAEGQHDFAIVGHGKIDGRGGQFPEESDPRRHRPMLIRFVDCQRVRLRDVTLLNPASWTSAWLYCDDIVVDGISIHSRANGNGDGLDFDGCQNVRVANSAFDNSDDSICLQTSRADKPCKYITVTNCIFTTRWAGMRIGLLSLGDFEQVTVSNCVFHDIEDAGLKIQMCEGAVMRNMVFSDLVMTNVPRPVFMTLNRQKAGVDTPEPVPEIQALTDIVFNNIRVTCTEDFHLAEDNAFIISGVPEGRIGNLAFSNISFTGGGGAGPEKASTVNEFPGDPQPEGLPRWPEYAKLGQRVPAWGLYARHVDSLKISESIFEVRNPDQRAALVCDDVGTVELSGVSFQAQPAEAMVTLVSSKSAFIHGCSIQGEANTFLKTDGKCRTNVAGNDLAGAETGE